MDNYLFNYSYNLKYNPVEITRPDIKTFSETVQELIKTNKNMIRFGDGEFHIMFGGKSHFQAPDSRLAERLKQLLKTDDEDILICIPRHVFYEMPDMSPLKEYREKWTFENRRSVLNLLNTGGGKTYYDTMCSQMYANFANIDFEKHFTDVRSIWEGKDITVICGEHVFKDIKHNVYDNAKSVEYVFCPSVNAFSQYESILSKCQAINKNRLLLITLGMTAKPLAFDLIKCGYRVLDFGHLAKDYDYFKRGIKFTNKVKSKFFHN
jgi:glycosyltransferase family protein